MNEQSEAARMNGTGPSAGSAELDSAIRLIENVAGFDDETTAVGDAWAVVLRYLRQPNAKGDSQSPAKKS